MGKYEWGLNAADAVYTDAAQSSWCCNPLIEALPDVSDEEELYEHLRSSVSVHPESLAALSVPERVMRVDQLFDVFQPWDIHIRLSNNVASAIRSGYIGRNPLQPDFVRRQRAIAQHIEQRDSTFSGMTDNAKATGFSVIGYSGMGKTSALVRALAQYPQKIIHTVYKGEPFPFTQITWMKLNCPFDSRVKGLCIEFFQEFDRITGENSYQRFAMSSRATTDLMLPQMALLASRHALGALVIDEIQNLNEERGNNAGQMLNFFTQLVNKIGVPVILVGTQAALEPLTADIATARRFSGPNGSIIMDRLKQQDLSWQILLGELTKYQWTDARADLLERKMQNVLYANTKGLVAHLINLLAQAQKEAIRIGRKAIDAKMVENIANSDENIFVRSVLNQIDRQPLSKTADRDFALQLARQRGQASAGAPPAAETAGPASPPVRKRGEKAQTPDFTGDILKTTDKY